MESLLGGMGLRIGSRKMMGIMVLASDGDITSRWTEADGFVVMCVLKSLGLGL